MRCSLTSKNATQTNVARIHILLGALGAAGVLYALSRTARGSEIAADIVGVTVDNAKRLTRGLISGEEGLRLEVYKDVAGYWTIGYGHLVKAGEPYFPYGARRTITQAEADQLLDDDTKSAWNAVDTSVRVPLKDSQRAALVSLTFNIGNGAFKSSTLLKKLNAGQYALAGDEFMKWVHANSVRIPGLVARRTRERELFLS